MTLGKRISALRRDQNLSQEAIADELCVSRQAVSKWENDQSVPDMQNLIGLAKLLKVDVEYLASGELTEEMESDPLPEEVAASVQKGKTKRGKRLVVLALIAAMIGNILFFCLWQYERNDRSELMLLCVNAASTSKSLFDSYDRNGSDAYYWEGVAEFRRFMQTYIVMLDGDHGAEYSWFNILYGHMIYDREAVERYSKELRLTLALLCEDPLNSAAHDAVFRLNNLIKHGDE